MPWSSLIIRQPGRSSLQHFESSIFLLVSSTEKDRFFRGLSSILQEKLYTANYQTFRALMNAAIAMEGFQRESQVEWKRKWVAAGSSSHHHTQKVQVVQQGPYQSSGGPSFQQP